MFNAKALIRKGKALSGKPAFVLIWFPVLWVLLGFARFAIMCFKFKNLAAIFGRNNGTSAFIPIVTAKQLHRAKQIKASIALATRYTPWKSNCFPQALIARGMLGVFRIPYALNFGLIRGIETQGLQAHAWVMSGPCAVSGGRGHDKFTVVGCFGVQSWGYTKDI